MSDLLHIMSACVEGSSQTTRIEIMRIKRGENIALQPLNPLPSLYLSDRFRVRRASPEARMASGDPAMARGPVGWIDLTISKPGPYRLDVELAPRPTPRASN